MLGDVDLGFQNLMFRSATKNWYWSSGLIRVTLVAETGMAGSCGAVVTFKIDREIAESVHRQLTDLPTDFPREIEYEQTVDSSLVLSQRHGVCFRGIATLVMNVKRVAV